MSPEQLSRRKAIAALSATAAVVLAGDRSANRKPAFHGRTENCAGPTYSATGPNAELYGADEGYPLPDVMEARRRGDPWEPKYRVAAFSHLDQIYPTRGVERAGTPSKFKCSTAEIYYDFRGSRFSLADYRARNAITGLLIAKDDHIPFEQYQYARTDRDRFVSQSMVKSITGLLIGIAVSEGAIGSVDDTPERYVAGFRGTEYGRTRSAIYCTCRQGSISGKAETAERTSIVCGTTWELHFRIRRSARSKASRNSIGASRHG